MKPSQIPAMLDLALKARKEGQIFNPLFTGEAGLGKSALVKQWVKKQKERNPNFFFIDLRIAYMEAPDLIGFPETHVVDGKRVTDHAPPAFWPRDPDAEGLILLEEPNRGTTGVMNCLMQVLTDRIIHQVHLPENVIIAGCINPDSAEYDVNHMDAALRNRFEEFEVEYDAIGFMDYMESQNWHEDIRMFVEQGVWLYKKPSEIAENDKYISPRTWEKVQAALTAGVKDDRVQHRLVMTSILGRAIGDDFHKFSFEEAPVTAKDLITDKKNALKRLKKQSDPETYQGGMIATTIDSIIKEYGGPDKDCPADKVPESLMAEVAKIIPSDQAINLIKHCGFKQTKGRVQEFFREFKKKYPELVEVMKSNIRIDRAVNKPQQ